MRAIGMVGVGLVGMVALIAAGKAIAAMPAPSKPPAPKPPAPKAPTEPSIAITGLPPDIAQAITAAMASNDPAVMRATAEQIADKYSLQAANLLDLATRLEGAPPTGSGASGSW